MSANYDATLGGTTDKSNSGNRSGSRSLSEQSSRVADEVHELGRVAVASAGEAASTLREKGEHALEAGAKRAKKAKGQFDDLVAEHPMKSVLIALGIGAVIGYALRRRS